MPILRDDDKLVKPDAWSVWREPSSQPGRNLARALGADSLDLGFGVDSYRPLVASQTKSLVFPSAVVCNSWIDFGSLDFPILLLMAGTMDGSRKFIVTGIVLPLIMLLAFSGCIGTAAQMLYILKGNKAKAAYSGLKNKRVAVVCISDASSYGPDALTQTLAKSLSAQLKMNVKKVTIIPYAEIENWKDQNGWAEVDPVQLGKDLEAQMVVALEMTGYSIREGQTMYKGRSTITTTVYDIDEDGEINFVHGPEYFEFPKSHARPAIGTSEAQFESAYLARIVAYTSRLFYDYEKTETFGEDAILFD